MILLRNEEESAQEHDHHPTLRTHRKKVYEIEDLTDHWTKEKLEPEPDF